MKSSEAEEEEERRAPGSEAADEGFRAESRQNRAVNQWKAYRRYSVASEYHSALSAPFSASNLPQVRPPALLQERQRRLALPRPTEGKYYRLLDLGRSSATLPLCEDGLRELDWQRKEFGDESMTRRRQRRSSQRATSSPGILRLTLSRVSCSPSESALSYERPALLGDGSP